jgi:lipopolysaccharide transport system permease protein
MNAWAYLYSYRRLLSGSVRADLQSRYAGSVFGLGWFILTPILFLVFYSTVYLVIFKLRPMGMDQWTYICHIMAGILPFLSVSESLAVGTQSISSNRDIFKNTVFPPEVLVSKTVIAGQAQLVVGLCILVAVALFRSGFHWSLMLLPVLLGLQVLFLVGACWILSLINLVFRDLQNIIGFLTMAIMVASPIAYTPDMVPERLRFFLWLNPMAHFILLYQSIVVHGTEPPLGSLITVVVLSLGFFTVGFFVFSRLKKVVANYA